MNPRRLATARNPTLTAPFGETEQAEPGLGPRSEAGRRGLMVFDHKGRLVKADASAEVILAGLGIHLTRSPRLRIDALDTSDPRPLSARELPDWLDPEWIEPVMEGSERLGTVVLIPGRSRGPLPAKGGLPPYKLRQALELIKAHIDRPLYLVQLAAAVALSPFHFHREFKRSTGITPHRYMVQMRIERAKTLLAESDVPLAVMAAQLGFADQSHFTSAFRRRTSMTPRSYRELKLKTLCGTPS